MLDRKTEEQDELEMKALWDSLRNFIRLMEQNKTANQPILFLCTRKMLAHFREYAVWAALISVAVLPSSPLACFAFFSRAALMANCCFQLVF